MVRSTRLGDFFPNQFSGLPSMESCVLRKIPLLSVPFPKSPTLAAAASKPQIHGRCSPLLSRPLHIPATPLSSIGFGFLVVLPPYHRAPTSRFPRLATSSSSSGGGDGDGAEGAVAGDIVLQVEGMMCDGCAASVKRILESQPQVSSASVSHKAGTALIWASSEVKIADNWQQIIGEKLSKHLTSCGFESYIKGSSS